MKVARTVIKSVRLQFTKSRLKVKRLRKRIKTIICLSMFPHIFSLFKYFIRQVETVEQMYMRGFYRPVSASTPSPSTSSAQRGGGLVYYQFKAILFFQEFSGQPGQGKEKHFLFPMKLTKGRPGHQ